MTDPPRPGDRASYPRKGVRTWFRRNSDYITTGISLIELDILLQQDGVAPISVRATLIGLRIGVTLLGR